MMVKLVMANQLQKQMYKLPILLRDGHPFIAQMSLMHAQTDVPKLLSVMCPCTINMS